MPWYFWWLYVPGFVITAGVYFAYYFFVAVMAEDDTQWVVHMLGRFFRVVAFAAVWMVTVPLWAVSGGRFK